MASPLPLIASDGVPVDTVPVVERPSLSDAAAAAMERAAHAYQEGDTGLARDLLGVARSGNLYARLMADVLAAEAALRGSARSI